jgi:hypothetical protein
MNYDPYASRLQRARQVPAPPEAEGKLTARLYSPAPDRDELDREAPTSPVEGALPFSLFESLGAEAKKTWLVDQLLGAGEASSFYGEPGAAKSVGAEDLGLHVAAGRSWHGRNVTQGSVLYLALERAKLVKRRAVAFRRHTGIDKLPFAIVSGELDFRDIRTADAIAATAAELERQTGFKVALIIVDTISRALCGGDENSPKDMGALVRTIGRVMQLTAAHLLCIHHSPVDGGNRQRGHSSLKGALDTTIHVAKSGGHRTATVTKANDSEEGQAIAFDLMSVEIERDEHGNATTAPVVVPADGRGATNKEAPARKLSDRQKLALQALSNCVLSKGKPTPASFGLSAATSAVSVADWRDELISTGVIESDGPNPREAFRQIRTALKTRGLIGERDSLIWLSS